MLAIGFPLIYLTHVRPVGETSYTGSCGMFDQIWLLCVSDCYLWALYLIFFLWAYVVFKYLVAEGEIKRVFEDFYRLFIDPEDLSLFFFFVYLYFIWIWSDSF